MKKHVDDCYTATFKLCLSPFLIKSQVLFRPRYRFLISLAAQIQRVFQQNLYQIKQRNVEKCKRGGWTHSVR